MTEVEVGFQPFNDLAGLDTGFQFAVFGEALFVCQLFEVGRRFAGLGLDVVQIGLEGHDVAAPGCTMEVVVDAFYGSGVRERLAGCIRLSSRQCAT
ncbi:hypothetical protein D3C76_1559800 [compost metagenome]